jgi:arginyl-tRNA synthetase
MAEHNVSGDSSLKLLQGALASMSLEQIPKHPGTYPEYNLADVYKSHVTELLASVTDVDPKVIFPAVQWAMQADKGDLVLAVPALRIKGKKPDVLAQEIAEKVKS